MKNYEKQRYSGNENGWHEPIISLGVTRIKESTADELNLHFHSTGIKYVETDKLPSDELSAPSDEADQSEPNLAIQGGKVVKAKARAKSKAVAAPKVVKPKEVAPTPGPTPPAEPA